MRSAVACVALLGLVGPAVSQVSAAQRTFVSRLGSDSNPCTRSAPCRQFQKAIDVVDVQGEVVALDSADYDPFVVTRSVTVAAPAGVQAAISPSTSTTAQAIVVDAPNATVTLRGLTVTWVLNTTAAGTGIVFVAGRVLHVEGCVIGGPFETGINAIAPNGRLFLKDTIVRVARAGLLVSNLNSPSAACHASVERSRFEGAENVGISVNRGGRASIRDSVLSGSFVGLIVFALDGDGAEASLASSMVSHNFSSGISCQGDSLVKVRVAGSTITGNGTGLKQEDTCILESLGDNFVRGNSVATAGTITVVPGQ